ncbi:MAG: tetratricopeptide repeat protein [Verrucomicrobia bacterium]|nr:tetratricopeptide repeat protein [Verrucomicrobiota bacterium]
MKVVDFFLGIALWVAWLAEKVLLWCLSIWAYIAGILCIGLVLISHWVALTVSNQVSGLHSPIFGYVRNHAGNPLLSWGVAVALLFAVSVWTYTHKHWRTLAVVAAGLLLMCQFGLFQVAYGEPGLLKQLADEEADWVAVQQFQSHFLPVTLRVEASNSEGPNLTANIASACDRLVAARYFMGMGWYLSVAVGLFCFFYARARLSVRDRSRLTKGTLLMAACLALAFFTRAAVAHFLVAWGQDAEARGEPDLAIERYRKAMQLDGWFAIHSTLYQRIGAIDANFGRLETLDYGVYYSEKLYAQGDYTEAIAELEKVIPKSGKLAPVFREREAEMWAGYGSALYRQRAVAAAIPAWHSAFTKDPSQWPAGFGLTRAYFEVGRYPESVSLSKEIIKRIRDPVLQAELHSDLGDSLIRLGNVAEAHLAYRQSFLLDYVYNWRALSDTIGAEAQISLQDSDAYRQPQGLTP